MTAWIFWALIVASLSWVWYKVAAASDQPIVDPARSLSDLRRRLSRAIMLTLIIVALIMFAKLAQVAGVHPGEDVPDIGLF